jgi:hypothetical protein
MGHVLNQRKKRVTIFFQNLKNAWSLIGLFRIKKPDQMLTILVHNNIKMQYKTLTDGYF